MRWYLEMVAPGIRRFRTLVDNYYKMAIIVSPKIATMLKNFPVDFF